MVTNLKNMIVDRLKLFQKKNNGKLPDRILVYRDGVSEVYFLVLFCSRISSYVGSIQHRQSGGTTFDNRSFQGVRYSQGTIQA